MSIMGNGKLERYYFLSSRSMSHVSTGMDLHSYTILYYLWILKLIRRSIFPSTCGRALPKWRHTFNETLET
jgi:hypothetical protein